MKSKPFDYRRASSVPEALDLLESFAGEAKLLAGGQSLLPVLNFRLNDPRALIDINGIAELSGCRRAGDTLIVGALTRHEEIETSDLVRDTLPLLSQAIRFVAHPAIRTRGTIGGSIALADPAAELPACCVALRAVIVLRGKDGERRVAAGDFFQGLYETALRPDEIVYAVEFPIPHRAVVCDFDEFARRHGDYALVGVASLGRPAGDAAASLDVVVFGATDIPVALRDLAPAGGRLDERSIAEIASAAREALERRGSEMPESDMRLHLAGVLVKRSLGRLASSLEGTRP